MTSSRDLLKQTLKTEVFGYPTGKPETDSKIDESAEKIAKVIDDYIVDVVSKISGTTKTSALPLLSPAVIVPMDGGASLLTSMTTNAAVPLEGSILPGSLTTN
jgi:hypothetical protein